MTKILATMGPASESEDMIRRLITVGVDCFRLNLSHGTFDEHAVRLQRIRKIAGELGAPIAVLADLPGPKIRVGTVPDVDEKGIMARKGDRLVFVSNAAEASVREREGVREIVLPTTYPEMIGEVVPGQSVLINDGAIRSEAIETRENGSPELLCRVTVGGRITSGKGINLPQTELSAPAISDRDWERATWAIDQGVDFLAMSFVRTAKEILDFRSQVEGYVEKSASDDLSHPLSEADSGGLPLARVPIVAKIEKPQAVADIEAIVEAADLIMVARGDLGVEMDIAAVPVAQKKIIAAAEAWGTPVIVATQMLETMIENATPTRAEASDVANAVLDGTDAVMLSGETAVGAHPDLVVETMGRIIDAVEEGMQMSEPLAREPHKFREERNPTAALAHGAWHTARDADATLIICWSERGGTAQYLSRNTFSRPIVAYSTNPAYARRMSLLRGIRPICSKAPERLIDWYDEVDGDVIRRGLAKDGDTVLLVAGRPLGRSRRTNTLTLHTIGLPQGAYFDDTE